MLRVDRVATDEDVRFHWPRSSRFGRGKLTCPTPQILVYCSA